MLGAISTEKVPWMVQSAINVALCKMSITREHHVQVMNLKLKSEQQKQ
jgi:hypothetical protein